MSMLLRTEGRLLARDPGSWFFGMLAPLIILAILGSLPDFRDASKDLGGLRPIDTYVPTLALFVLTMLGVTALPGALGGARDLGVLKRLRTTPVGPGRLLAAQLAVHAVCAVATIALLIAVGHVAFDVPLPDPLGGFAVALVLAGGAMLSLGLLVAAVAPNARVAAGLGTIVFFPLMFVGGLWVPRAAMGATLLAISDWTPTGAAVGALQDATTGGAFPDAGYLLVLAGWTVLFLTGAVRLFRWE